VKFLLAGGNGDVGRRARGQAPRLALFLLLASPAVRVEKGSRLRPWQRRNPCSVELLATHPPQGGSNSPMAFHFIRINSGRMSFGFCSWCYRPTTYPRRLEKSDTIGRTAPGVE